MKDFYQIARDPSSIIIAFFYPMMLLFLFGYGVSLDPDNIKVGLVIEDSSPEVQTLIRSFKNTTYFDPEFEKTPVNLYKRLDTGELRGLIYVPQNFTRNLKKDPPQADILVIADGSETNTANFVQNYSKGIIQNWLTQLQISEGAKVNEKISIENRFWFNPELKSRNYLVPSSLAVIMTLIGTLLTALVVAREWERGTMEAIMSTPVSMVEILTGKLIPYFILGMFSMVLVTLVAIFLYKIPFEGSFILLTLVSAVFLIVALEAGLFISISTKNQFVASQVALITGFLPAFILSGFIFEPSSMPLPIRIISDFVPAKYFVNCLQTLFLSGNIMEVILPNLGVLGLMGLVIHKINTVRIHKRLT